MEYQVKEPIPDSDCPREEDIKNPKCQACLRLIICEKEAHDSDECFDNCRLCEKEHCDNQRQETEH